MKSSLPSNWVLRFRSQDARRRRLGRAKPRVAVESVETRCLLSATNPLAETVWANEYIVENDIDPTIYVADYSFDWAPIGNEYAYDLTFDEMSFIDSTLEWDTSPSWLEDDFEFDHYEEIRDSFQAAIDGTFNGFIDSIWYQHHQSIEYIGDVIYLTLESPFGMLVPVEVFVAGGNAETVLSSGASILQQVEQLLVAPENNLFDTSTDRQVVDVSVNLFQFNDGTSDQLVIDSYEIFRQNFSSPGFLESEFVIVNDFELGTDFFIDEPILDIFGDEELLAIADVPAIDVDEMPQVVIEELSSELDESTVAAAESGGAGIEAEVESAIVSDAGDPSLRQEATTESNLSADAIREAGKARPAEKRALRSRSNRFNLELREKQKGGQLSRPDQSSTEQAVDVGAEGVDRTDDVPSQTSDRWQRLRRQASLAARQIAASGVANHLSAIRHTGVIPATTGSLAMHWGATVAAFAHSALKDQLQGLTTVDTNNEQPEESGEQMTYAQVASATGTILIGATAAFQAIRKRRQTNLQRRWGSDDAFHEKETHHNFSTNNAKQSPKISRATFSGLPVNVDKSVRVS